MRPEVRECNPGKRLRRRIDVGTIRDISIKHDIKHVVSVPLKSNGSPLAGHVDLMPPFWASRSLARQTRCRAVCEKVQRGKVSQRSHHRRRRNPS